jgi:GMP synthase (glutamine-hydrolysing)
MIPELGEASPAPPLVVIEHDESEGPGLLADVAAINGVNLRRSGLRDPLPSLDRVAGLVVLGGPQAAHGTDPRLRAEVALLHEAVTRGLPVLGIGLGAQLLAVACGGRVLPGERGRELGLGTITLTAAGRDDPLFAGSPEGVPVVHFHGDTFELPRGSCHLASSELYPSQAFRLGRAYGFQFHLEVDGRLLAAWAPQLSLPASAMRWLAETEAVRRGILSRWVARARDSVP